MIVSINRNLSATLLLIFLLAPAGCLSARKINTVEYIPVGMKEEQVLQILGHPVLKDRREDGTEIWKWVHKTPLTEESASLTFRNGRVIEFREDVLTPEVTAAPSPPSEVSNPPDIEGSVQSTPQREKSSEEIWLEQLKALAVAQFEARLIEEKARASKPILEVPIFEVAPYEAWHKGRQFVTDRLAPRRTIFPNPRFAPDGIGEDRIDGNIWRAWGFVDTVDSFNSPTRLHWIVEMELLGESRWIMKNLVFQQR